MSESDDLDFLLSNLPEPDERPRRSWPWVVAGLALVAAAAFVWFGGNEPSSPIEAGSSSTTAASVSSPPTSEGLETTLSTVPHFRYPEARFNASMAFDPVTSSVVLLGGHEGLRDDPMLRAWLLDADRVWSPLDATFEPPGRDLGQLAPAGGGQVLLLGGAPDPTIGCGLHLFVTRPEVDVWSLDVQQRVWERAFTSGGPSDRWGHAAAYVPELDKVLLFGGVGTERGSISANLLGDTWLYDPAVETWEQVQVESGPPPLACHGMAHDPGDGLVYLWGGQTALSTGQDSLWSFDPAALEWREVPSEGAPQPRWTHQMLYEPITGHIYVIGGSGRQVIETDSGSTTAIASTAEVWALDPRTLTWAEREPLPAPLAGHAAAIDGRGGIVVFSGMSTLVYDTALDAWSDITPYELLDREG